jgi:hypothetical protein
MLYLVFMGVADHPSRLHPIEVELRYDAEVGHHLEARTHEQLRRRICLLVITHFVEVTEQPKDNQRH